MNQDASLHCETTADNPSRPSRTRSDQEHSTPFKAADIDSMCRDDDVLAEAARVEAKLASQVNTTTEVVVRFDFMSDQDSRVSGQSQQTIVAVCPHANSKLTTAGHCAHR